MGLPPNPHGGHLGQECEGPEGANRPARSIVLALEWVTLIDPFRGPPAASTLRIIEFQKQDQ